ncbi:hypothetical protein BJX99DRAFT_97507 [Aspergillus californicus]
MVNAGYTDLGIFCNRLKEHELVSEPYLESLLAKHQSTLMFPGEPDFVVFEDKGTVIGFQFENVPIVSEDIAAIKDNTKAVTTRKKVQWLTTEPIRLFCLCLRVNLSQGDYPWKIYFFCPLRSTDLEAGWNHILDSDPKHVQNILTAHYLVFPVHDKDHWFTVIVASSGGTLIDGETPNVYFLDSKGYSWMESLGQPMRQIIATMRGSTERCEIYEDEHGTLPQQTKELCGYYLMLYLELFSISPDKFLSRVKNKCKTPMSEPGKMDQVVATRFNELVEEFWFAKKRGGRLVTGSGRPILDGDLTYLARGINFTDNAA